MGAVVATGWHIMAGPNGGTLNASDLPVNVLYFRDTTVEQSGVFNLNRPTVQGSSPGFFDAYNTTVTTNGEFDVGFNVKVNDTTVSDGGVVNVRGMSHHTTINDGGLETLTGWPGFNKQGAVLAQSDNTDIFNHGEQDVGSLGLATNTEVHKGGYQHILAGGQASGTMIRSGGLVFVDTNGIIRNVTIDGGTLELQQGALTSGFISFGGDNIGKLQIDQSLNGHTAFQATITNFAAGDTIHLTKLASNTASCTFDSGLLTVSSGGASQTFLIDGGSAKDFRVADDGRGGTLVIAEGGLQPQVIQGSPYPLDFFSFFTGSSNPTQSFAGSNDLVGVGHASHTGFLSLFW